MRHFVQYHNPDVRGEVEASKDNFGITTDKHVDHLLGDRVWLVSKERKPPRYVLCETFIVDKVGPLPDGPQRNLAEGSQGQTFNPPLIIGDKGWFERLLRATGNFAFGLTHIRDDAVVRGLLGVSAGTSTTTKRMHSNTLTGARFGVPVENRRVERAAVAAVQRYLEGRGWSVKSVEARHLGFDLMCQRGRKTRHVEVKGIRGATCSFLITSGEQQVAAADPHFLLCAVTNALDARRRKISQFTGEQFAKHFELQPVTLVAKPRRVTS